MKMVLYPWDKDVVDQQGKFPQATGEGAKGPLPFYEPSIGLINKSNPCRCDRKTKSFIEAGWMDKEQMKSNTSYVKRISAVAPEKSENLDHLTDVKYAGLFRSHPFQEKDRSKKLIDKLLSDDP